ncbi:hypothetical protein BDF21DRAFT_401159 [Thamnidium elegans]|nr:hypothetical protein BDF21DRAFT_401159 [Thamnidium elegans]
MFPRNLSSHSKFNGPNPRKCSILENHAVKQGVYFRLNTKVLENSSKQPDFACREIINSNWTGPIIVGEVKGEDQKDDKYICLLDLIVIGIHIVALQVTFYIITLVADGFYVMMEICSIPLPRDTTELRSYITNFDDFLTVLQYSSKCKVSNDKKKKKSMTVLGINAPEFDRIITFSWIV